MRMPAFIHLILCCCLWLSGSFLALFAQEPVGHGGGEPPFMKASSACMTPAERRTYWDEMQQSRSMLIQQGKLTEVEGTRAVQLPQLSWPLKQRAGSAFFDYYTISNYVDHDGTSGIEDFMCEERAYDGHRGTDFALWPFSWEMMDNNEVEVIAAAKGVIINKLDGNFDKNCSFTGNWNAVYVEHNDGSIAWYGHLKKNTLTTKALGDTVYPGDYLGLVGSSGFSTGPHLHLEFFDAGGDNLDPYFGGCNPTTQSSLWQNQNLYFDPQLNFLQTGDSDPFFNGSCPNEQGSNRADQFDPSQLVYFSAYYRDHATTEPTNYRILDANGGVFRSWTHSSPENYSSSYWWWSYRLPPAPVEGTWVFEATFKGQTYTHPFTVGTPSSTPSLHELKVSVSPNPVSDVLRIDSEEFGLEAAIMDVRGRIVLQRALPSSGQLDVHSLTKGIYVLKVTGTTSGKSFFSKIEKL